MPSIGATPLITLAFILILSTTFGVGPLAASDWPHRVEQVFRRAHRPPPVRDAALDAAATRAANAGLDVDVRAMLREHGVYDGFIVPLVAVAPHEPEVAAGLLHYIRRHVAPQHVTHYGLSFSGQRLAAVFVRRNLELEPVKPLASTHRFAPVRGRLAPGFEQPRIFVARPDGGVIQIQVPPTAQRRLDAVVPLPDDGRYLFEVLAIGPRGQEVIALLPVDVGDAPTVLPTVRLGRTIKPFASPNKLARRLLELVNRERARFGLHKLGLDKTLRRTASAHARSMAKTGVVAHVVPGGTDAIARVAAAGVHTTRFYENVAMAPTIERVHAELWASPSHRHALLDPTVTKVGIGVAPVSAGNERVLYVVEHLAAR